ncbi:MAG: hypothetical protein A2Z12_07015 [Actinobacteria bacterium RBG_16_68_21]|nr:MAG: hypothetical protein A2Z12_07015 [Actinobacteria bacterium RBG_16_68_21]
MVGHFLVSIAAWTLAWTVVGPILMSILLLRVSGVTLLERTLRQRRPGYEECVTKTAASFPRRPRP